MGWKKSLDNVIEFPVIVVELPVPEFAIAA